jgi:hypothetical protein
MGGVVWMHTHIFTLNRYKMVVQENLVHLKFRGPRKNYVELWSTSIIQNILKISRIFIEKISILLVLYVAICHIITTNYHSTSCSVLVNVIFNTCFGCYRMSHRQILFQRYFCHFKLLGSTVWKLLLQDRFFFRITNYQGVQNNQVHFVGLKLKLKFEIVWNFKLTRFYCIVQALCYCTTAPRNYCTFMHLYMPVHLL